MNLLEIVQAVCDELALNRPQKVVTAQDAQTRQLYALLNGLGSDICREYPWQVLNQEYLLTTNAFSVTGDITSGSAVISNISDTSSIDTNYSVSGDGISAFSQVSQVGVNSVTLNMPVTRSASGETFTFAKTQYPLPSDWLHSTPQTEWDRTNRWPLMGPTSSQDWQSFKSGIVYSGPRLRFRIARNKICVSPMPSNGSILAMEYISNSWVQDASGNYLQKYESDSDTALFPDRLLITGLKARWKGEKGLDNSIDTGSFQGMIERMKAQDKGAPVLSMSPQYASVLLGTDNIPDGNWPGG